MNKKENDKCIKLMRDAMVHAERSNYCYKEVSENKALTDTDRMIKELEGQNSLGYAEGINQVLVSIGFKHEGMKKLNQLLH